MKDISLGMYRGKISIFVLIIAMLFILIAFSACAEKDISDEKTKVATNVETNLTYDSINNKRFKVEKVIDGDTLKLEGLKGSIRLLCVDTEETFKGKTEQWRDEAYNDWDSYLARNHKPGEITKYPTPHGEAAKQFAIDFFEDVDDVTIEFDSEDRMTGFFDRYLCYIFATKDDQEINFNLELVKQGYSPYFTKYGYSVKYNTEFEQASLHAQESGLGIYNEASHHYPDYSLRSSHWESRAASISEFAAMTESSMENHFLLQNNTHWDKLDIHVGDEVTIMGTIDDFRKNGPPYKIFMSHKRGRSIMLYTDTENLHLEVLENYSNDNFCIFSGTLNKDDKGFKMEYTKIDQFKPSLGYSVTNELQDKLS